MVLADLHAGLTVVPVDYGALVVQRPNPDAWHSAQGGDRVQHQIGVIPVKNELRLQKPAVPTPHEAGVAVFVDCSR